MNDTRTSVSTASGTVTLRPADPPSSRLSGPRTRRASGCAVAGRSARKTQGTASNGPSGPQHASNGRIEGVTVGMALNKAVDICVLQGVDNINSERLWRTASMIIRVAQELQSGNLAPVTATNEVPSEEVPF